MANEMPATVPTRIVLFVSIATAASLCLAVAYGTPPQPSEVNAEADPAAERDSALVAADGHAMSTMMSAMAVKPTGNADYDFASAMIPHHQGAIEMALAELKFGRNEQLR